MKRKTIIITGIVVLGVAGLGYLGLRQIGISRAAGERSLQTAVVQRGSLSATVSTAGAIQTSSTIDLAFQTGGQVKEVRVAEGDQVKAGQVIACLDATNANLEVAAAEAGLAASQVRLEQAKQPATAAEVAAAQTGLVSAQEALKELQAGPSATDVEVARLKWEQSKNQLWSAQSQRDGTCGNPAATDSAKNQAQASVNSAELAVQIAEMQYKAAQQGPSAKELAAAQSQVAQAQLNLSKLTAGPNEADVRAAEVQVKQSEISLQQAKIKQAQTCLTAPFDGTISRLSLQVGQMAGSSTQAGSISSVGGLQVTVDMPEVDVTKVKVGQQADITLDALPGHALKGHVAAVANSGTSTQGVVNYRVTIGVDAADPDVKPGMTASVSIIVERREGALLVPSRAIRSQGTQRVVQVLHEGQVVEVPVQVGMSGDGSVEILGDTLREGDRVVVSTQTRNPLQRIGGGMGGVQMGGTFRPD